MEKFRLSALNPKTLTSSPPSYLEHWPSAGPFACGGASLNRGSAPRFRVLWALGLEV